MTDVQEQPATAVQLPAGSIVIDRGRYAIFQTPDGGWSVLRSTPICERCESCGCGEQQQPIPISAQLVPFITGQASASMKDMFAMVKGMFNGGQ